MKQFGTEQAMISRLTHQHVRCSTSNVFTCIPSAGIIAQANRAMWWLKCGPIASCANKQKKKNLSIKPLRMRSVTTVFQPFNTFARTWLTPVWDQNGCNLNQEVWIQTFIELSQRQTPHWYALQVLDAKCNTFWDVLFLCEFPFKYCF